MVEYLFYLFMYLVTLLFITIYSYELQYPYLLVAIPLNYFVSRIYFKKFFHMEENKRLLSKIDEEEPELSEGGIPQKCSSNPNEVLSSDTGFKEQEVNDNQSSQEMR